MTDTDFSPSSEDIANYLKSDPNSVQNSQTQPSAFSQLWPYAAGVAAPALAKGAAALAGKVSPMLSALFLSKPMRTNRGTIYHKIVDDTKPNIDSVGSIYLTPHPEKGHLHIKSVASHIADSPLPLGHPAVEGNELSQVFGHSEMKSMLDSLKNYYPWAKSIGGNRVSGSRLGPFGEGGKYVAINLRKGGEAANIAKEENDIIRKNSINSGLPEE